MFLIEHENSSLLFRTSSSARRSMTRHRLVILTFRKLPCDLEHNDRGCSRLLKYRTRKARKKGKRVALKGRFVFST